MIQNKKNYVHSLKACQSHKSCKVNSKILYLIPYCISNKHSRLNDIQLKLTKAVRTERNCPDICSVLSGFPKVVKTYFALVTRRNTVKRTPLISIPKTRFDGSLKP